ncbi:hypothetical protein ACXR6G_18375 [Ancylomarina sp. YFZ004]
MTVSTKSLRKKYDGRGPNFVFDRKKLTPNAIYLVCEYDFYTHYDDKAYMTQEFPSISEAMAYIGYGLMASDLSHRYIEACTIGDSNAINYFLGDSEDWESREDFEDSEIESDEKEIKLWIEKVDQLLERKSEFQLSNLDELIKDFNHKGEFFKVVARGDLMTLLKSEYCNEQIQSFSNSYINRGNDEKDPDHPMLVLRTLLNQDCFNPTNEKHEKIALEVMKQLDD